MKKILIACIAIATIVACDNPVTEKIKETKQNVENVTKASKEINKMGDDIKELQGMEPLTNEEMKTWLPESVNGMKRVGYKAGQASYMKIASIEATYTNDDKTKTFKINIIDGAGEIGASATAGARMMLAMDMEEEDEYKTKRTLTRNNVRAMEEYKKKSNSTVIQLMQGKRFYLQVNAKNMEIDETWEAIDDLDLDDLG